MSVILVVSYLFTGFAGCSVNPGISCGARKLTRTPRVKKKEKKIVLYPEIKFQFNYPVISMHDWYIYFH